MGHCLRHCLHNVLYVGTWNVHLLVETSRNRRVCCSHHVAYGDTGVERKLDLLVKELARYCISIAGIQEMKWFGLTSGPLVNGHFYILVKFCLLMMIRITIRREGVGILLDGRATAACRAAGSCGQLCLCVS